MKKVLSLLLVLSMVFAMVACGGDKPSDGPEPTSGPLGDPRVINIGTWYTSYYTSEHDSIDDNPDVQDVEVAQMQLDNMRAIEQKYNVELYYKNLTWNGTIESINTSIMAGSPNCDIYMVDLQFGVPAVLAGYAMSLEEIGVEKINDDVLKGFNFTNDGKTYLFLGSTPDLGGFPLGYNKDMIEAANLPDPYQLYLDGEWTWDAWVEMMEALNDPENGVYAFRGAWTNTLDQILLSNGASIAGIRPDADGNIVEGISSKATTECLDFMREIYVDRGLSFWNASCDEDWNSSVYAFGEGGCAFFPAAAWIIDEADPDHEINLGVVPWPLGPSVSSYDEVAQIKQGGTYYMIPKGVKDPLTVYNVIYDYTNWYGGDVELRDDFEWFEEQMAGRENNPTNFEVLKGMSDEPKDTFVDLWMNIEFPVDGPTIRGMLEGNFEVAQVIESNKNIVQDYLDTYFGN